MTVTKPSETRCHPIKVVVRRTGLSADVLRAWERRYAAVAPGRSATGRRFYSDADIERLALLKRVTESGRSIGQVAGMTTGELTRMLEDEDAARPDRSSRPSIDPGSDGDRVARCLRLVETFDAAGLRAALQSAALTMPLALVLDSLLVPLLAAIGDRWRDGTLGISQEHLATATVESFLSEVLRAGGSTGASRIIVTTPSGQRHAIGALLAAAAAVTAGWNAVFLGADLPADDIADAVEHTGAEAVALSIVSTTPDRSLPAELTRLRKRLPEGMPLFVGGAGSGAYRDVLSDVGAQIPPNLTAFRSRLGALATGSSRE